MVKTKIPNGTIHGIPKDLKDALISHPKSLLKWQDITPLARNEWICWITSAKKTETRNHRLKRTYTELVDGKRRPCCWAGCVHRKN